MVIKFFRDHQKFSYTMYLTTCTTTKVLQQLKDSDISLIPQRGKGRTNKNFLTLTDFQFSYHGAETFRSFQNLQQKKPPMCFETSLSKNKITHYP